MTIRVEQYLSNLPKANQVIASGVQDRSNQILRPTGALARLDEIAIFIASWQQTLSPQVLNPKILIFASNHGISDAGVSNYPSDITEAMVNAFQNGVSSINAIGRLVNAEVDVIDVGVRAPTKDFRYEDSMTSEEFEVAFFQGVEAANALDTDLLVLGEMGIGNTSSAAAVAAATFNDRAMKWVGRGTGVDDEGFERKKAAVEEGLERVRKGQSQIQWFDLLRRLGGKEMVSIAGAAVAARHRRIPVLLDGYVVASALAPIWKHNNEALDHCWAGHRSPEPGHARLLSEFGLEPILELDLRLGEGSGAAAAVPLVQMACALVSEVPTFDEYLGTRREKL